MKKIIASLLASLFVFAGCAGEEKVAAPTPSESQELNDLVPMVMVDGKLYLDSGEESTEARCGVMDGKITSSVPQSEKPKENDQSNFGTGYEYQMGPGAVHVVMNGKWMIFKEEAGENRISSLSSQSKEFVNLEKEDAEFLKELFKEGSWEEGTPRCLSDVEINLGGMAYTYHSDCGTFSFDGKSLRTGDALKQNINSVLEKYVSLGQP